MSSGARPEEDARGNALPLYRHIAGQLADRVANGELARHGRLPSERELCEAFSVSRVTLRQALTLLARQNVVIPQPGRGWFVSPTLSEPPGALLSFTEMAGRRGLTVSSVVLGHDVRSATIDEAEGLSYPPGAPVLDLVRLRLVEGVATALDHSCLPLIMMKGLEREDFATQSLHATLAREYNIVPSRADYSVEAGAATEWQAQQLGVPVGAPVLRTSQTNFDQRDRAVELNETTYRGDRYRMRATLTAPTRERDTAVHSLSLRATVPRRVGRSRLGTQNDPREVPWQ